VTAVGSSTKALRIETKDELLEFWPRLRGLSKPAVAQETIPGPETAVVSYHVYVDEHGEVAGEFAGHVIAMAVARAAGQGRVAVGRPAAATAARHGRDPRQGRRAGVARQPRRLGRFGTHRPDQ